MRMALCMFVVMMCFPFDYIFVMLLANKYIATRIITYIFITIKNERIVSKYLVTFFFPCNTPFPFYLYIQLYSATILQVIQE